MPGTGKSLIFLVVFAFTVAGCRTGSVATGAASAAGSPTPTDTSTVPAASPPAGGTSPVIRVVTLGWIAPTTRVDDTPVSLSEIAGYRLYYGPTATDTPDSVNINDGSATQYTINLPAGRHYFRISAIDSNGFEGQKSVAVLKTIN